MPSFLGLQLFSNHFTRQHVPTGNGAGRLKGLRKFRFLKLFPSISCVGCCSRSAFKGLLWVLAINSGSCSPIVLVKREAGEGGWY